MIGANIDNGDLVVLEVRQTADNRDIVAVATDAESATLKRYMKMGDTILLIPEWMDRNPIYWSGSTIIHKSSRTRTLRSTI